VVFSDVTDRRLAEERLKKSYDLLDNLARMVPGVVYQFRLYPDGRSAFPYSSPGMKDIYEVSPDEVKEDAAPVYGRLHPEDSESVATAIQESARTLNTFYCEFRVVLPRQGLRWRWSQAQPERTDDGGTLWHGIISDITERKQAEEELKRRENLLNRIFEVLPVGLWLADKNGMLLRGNPAGVRIWGGEPHVPISEYGVFKAWRMPKREPIEADDWALAKTVRDGVTINDELLEIESFDGKKKTILNYTAPILDENGAVDGAIVVNLDISDRKALEEQLSQAQKMESVGRLAGGVAHDFNNMLSVIIGNAELALNSLDSPDQVYSEIVEIQKAAQRSADLTRQLLAFARKQTATPKVLDLNETIESMLKMLQRLIGEDIDLLWKPGKVIGQVRIDPAQIDQLLANMLVNARDAIGHRVGRVVIETDSAEFNEEYCGTHVGYSLGNYVMLTVSDDGCGMDETTMSNIFEPFFTTKGVGEGTGLGLATVYGIIKQNQGFINVYSEPGHGSTFRIYLPEYQSRKAEMLIELTPQR
jgi:PAS domain S-box-containing protein